MRCRLVATGSVGARMVRHAAHGRGQRHRVLTPVPSSAQVVLEEGNDRKVIFSTFDPDVATLVRLKQPRYPVRPSHVFQTCCMRHIESYTQLLVVNSPL